jgi:hypothetical protein
VRPEVAVILLAESLSCHAVGLTRESSCEDVDGSSVNREVCLRDVIVLYCVRPIMMKYLLTKGIPFAMEYVFPSHPFGGEVETSDA